MNPGSILVENTFLTFFDGFEKVGYPYMCPCQGAYGVPDLFEVVKKCQKSIFDQNRARIRKLDNPEGLNALVCPFKIIFG